MTTENRSLEDAWCRVESGIADEDERINVAAETGRAKDSRFVPQLLRSLDDEEPEVRYYALQSLVLDLREADEVVQQRCWSILREDFDDDVRSLAATCLGSIFFGSRSGSVFAQLLDELKSSNQPPVAKAMIYSALFKVAGRPPLEWPGLVSSRKVFEDTDVDWGKVAWLQDQLDH